MAKTTITTTPLRKQVKQQETGEERGCLNIFYNQFSQYCAKDIMDNYFYAKYLPGKLDSLYSHLIRSRGKTLTEKLDSGIKVRFF